VESPDRVIARSEDKLSPSRLLLSVLLTGAKDVEQGLDTVPESELRLLQYQIMCSPMVWTARTGADRFGTCRGRRVRVPWNGPGVY